MTEAKKSAVPDGVKKPSDRKPKAEDAPKVLTADVLGREWTVPVEALDDFELLDDFHALDQGRNVTRFPSVLRRLLDDDQRREALELLRDEKTGRVSIEAGIDFVGDLMQAINPSS